MRHERDDDDTCRPSRPPQPTSHLPGTTDKVEELARRARLGMSLFAEGDGFGSESRALVAEQLPNSSHRRLAVVAETAAAEATPLTAFGARLREIRTGRGLGLRQLALMSGMAHNSLSDLERGKSRPTAETLVALADALRLTLDRLIGRTPPPAA